MGGYNSRGFVEVLAASQTTTTKEWFQGTADAVRQYMWLFDEACRDGVEDFLILSGACAPPRSVLPGAAPSAAPLSSWVLTLSALPGPSRRASLLLLIGCSCRCTAPPAGDHLYRMDYREFVAAHRAAGADITVAALPCAEEQAQAFGLMKIDDSGRIVEFAEKPKGEALKKMQVDTTILGLDAET